MDLKCEYLIDPLGIDAGHPRLTWRMSDGRQGAAQTAYELVVGTDSVGVSRNKGNCWESGKINTSAAMAAYAGKGLEPFTRYYWRVLVWDKDGAPAQAGRIASFETGVMGTGRWSGSWISDGNSIQVKPAPYFRKVFTADKKIRAARAYIAVAGLYELYINGQRIGDHRLDPMYTRFDRRNLYVTYDVTAEVQEGKNAIGVLLGNGWYNFQSYAVWGFDKAPWRGRPAFCMDLRVTYEDGSTEIISSDEQWKTSLSPVIFNSIYTGEHYDARLEQPGWNTTAFDDSAWKGVINRAAPSGHIVAQTMQPIKNVEEIAAQTMTRINATTYVFDLGRNIAGVSRITVRGTAGMTLRLKHGERLYPNGEVDQSNISVHYRPRDDSDPFQTDIFILKGNGEESFMPRFNYKGFQYVEVNSDQPVTLTKESLVGYFMHSAVPPVGHIHSSNPTIDRIWSATNHSYLSNLFGYPTDCPQREKNGWTGDAHIAAQTGLYDFDGITIYEKWMADHRDEQQPNGILPSIIPTDGWGYEWGNGPDWTSTIALIPWDIYLFYGDTLILAENYDHIKRYVDHIDEVYPSGLTSWGLGDWVPVKSVSPVELTSSAYYFADVSILGKAAKLLGKQDDFIKYSALAAKIKNAFNEKYFHPGTGIYGSGLQTELSVPLYYGLAPDSVKYRVATNLAARIAADSSHLDVGILGAEAVLNALSENGFADVAYRLAAREAYPSWGWWIVNGATTLYENWQIDAKSDISLNHIMFGEIGAWLFKGPGGIKPDPENPGFKNVLLEPHFVAGLDRFEATHESPYGTILSSWARERHKITYAVTLPANTTATIRFSLSGKERIYLDGKRLTGFTAEGTYQVEAGSYQFVIR